MRGTGRHCGASSGRQRSKRGQALVEFALILPLLITLLFAIIDFGYFMFVEISVNNAVRIGARRAAMNNLSRAAIIETVRKNAVGADLSRATISITTFASDYEMPRGLPSVRITCVLPHKLFNPTFTSVNTLQVRSSYKAIVTTYPGREGISF